MNGQEPQTDRKLHVPGVIVFLIILVLFGAFFFMQSSSQSDVVPGESIVVEEREDGRLVVSDLENGFEVIVPEGWNNRIEDDKIFIDNISDLEVGASGVGGEGCRSVISPTDIDNIREYISNSCEADLDCDSYEVSDFNEKIIKVVSYGSFMGSGSPEYYLKPTSHGNLKRITILCSDSSLEASYKNEVLNSIQRL